MLNGLDIGSLIKRPMDIDKIEMQWVFMSYYYKFRSARKRTYTIMDKDGRLTESLSRQDRIMKKYAGYFLNKSQNPFVRGRVNGALNRGD
jgi:hypothetical protein